MVRFILLLVLFGLPLSGLSQSNYMKRRPPKAKVPSSEPAEKSEAQPVVKSETQPAAKEIRRQPAVQIPAEQMRAIENAFYFVKGKNGSGSAFLMKDDSGVWLVSNSHVFEHTKSPKISNIKRDEIALPAVIEVATDRDLIRFRVDRTNGLSLAESCNYNQPIYAFGDSGGAGVLTVLSGNVVAMGSDRLEISSNIIPGNSGGPVINESNQVVGVSSYLLKPKSLPDWITKDTPFADARRMALRLNDATWVRVDMGKYLEEAEIVNEVENGVDAFFDIMASLSEDSTKPITSTIDNDAIQEWLRKHNQLASKFHTAYRRNETRYLPQSIKKNIIELAEVTVDLERSANPKQVTTSYFEVRLKSYREMYKSIREHMETAYSGLN
ncbi:MAG: trypsin-like peptidase domain-containing protein [Kiritimatiellaceae bacterium]|nr:trypsin-like peptidase domain-containing protein [Kiritimatiellaceae bacterium]